MKIRIHKEGWPVILLVLVLIVVLLVVVNLFVPKQTVFHGLFYLSAGIFFFYVVRFFRRPERPVRPDNSIVLSGADGKVVVIEETMEQEYFRKRMRQVSIFMSPTNVHVNWYPVPGQIKYFRHIQGSYFIASTPKSSNKNERTTTVVETPDNIEIMFRQIAGTVARRIVCYAKEGKTVQQGDEMGIIKFGSRFDLFLPLDATLMVKLGDAVQGNITEIAHLNNPPGPS
jgi:phosphatidylserine decarboxylase